MIAYQRLCSSEIPSWIGQCQLVGPESIVSALATPTDSCEGHLLVYAATPAYLCAALGNQKVIGVMTTRALYEEHQRSFGERFAVLVAEPSRVFWQLHTTLYTGTEFYRDPDLTQDPTIEDSVIAPSAVIHRGSRIGKGCVIGDRSVILPGVIIGNNVHVQAGSIIGSEGFQYVKIDGRLLAIPHVGKVCIGHNVDIGGLCAIDKGLFADTVIGDDTKLDNLVHVAHSCCLGQRCLLAASATLSGSVQLGDDVWVGPGATVSDHISVGRGARVSLGAVVTMNVPEGTTVTGNFAIEHRVFLNALRGMLRDSSRARKTRPAPSETQ